MTAPSLLRLTAPYPSEALLSFLHRLAELNFYDPAHHLATIRAAPTERR